MRAALLAGILVMTAAGAEAKPWTMPSSTVTQDTPRLNLPSEDRFAAAYARRAAQSGNATFDRQAAQSAQQSGLSFGPFQAETVSDPRPGKHKSVMQYRLNGVEVFGGAIGGNLGGHGAMVSLHWQSAP